MIEHTNISPQDILNLLLLKPALDDQSPATVHTPTSSQFRKQELHNVVFRPFHPLADVGYIGKNGPSIAFTQALGRRNLV